MIISRFIHFFLHFRSVARKGTYLWLHDTRANDAWEGKFMPDLGAHFTYNLLPLFNKVICVSPWHKETICSWGKYPEENFTIIGNASANEFDYDVSIKKEKNRFIFCSDPERGLDILLVCYKRIFDLYKSKVNEKTEESQKEITLPSLHIFWNEIKNEKLLTLINTNAKQLNIVLHKKVSPDVLFNEMMKSEYWLYPNSLHETFCINALDAQKAKCICISRYHSGLITTVGDRGILVEGDPNSLAWQDSIVHKTVSLMCNEKDKTQYREAGYKWAIKQKWDEKAKIWEEMFNKD